MHNIRRTYTLCLIAAIVILSNCFHERTISTDASCHSQAVAVAVIQDWYRHAMLAERHSEGYRSPVVARMYAYLGIAMYESACPDGPCLSSVLRTDRLYDRPERPEGELYLPAILNGCFSRMLDRFFLGTAYAVEEDRHETKSRWEHILSECVPEDILNTSAQWGAEVADVIFTWSATDSLGHYANLHNYDRAYQIPTGPGKWTPSPELPMPPLLPYWESIRTFVISHGDYPVIPPLEYSDEKGSPYYNEVYEVYALSQPLSAENMWIAEFWSDDLPGLTFSPSSRWISVAHQIVDQEAPELSIVLETYLKTGIVINDMTVTCWKAKYTYHAERPEDYVRRMIDSTWHSLHPPPPFPAYPSGHAALGASAAEVLTNIYGENYRFTDRSHEGRMEFRGEPRKFASFKAMATENAFSRLALGVHIRSDCEEGMRLGRLVGKHIADLEVPAIRSDLSMTRPE